MSGGRSNRWLELQVIDSPAVSQTAAEFGSALALDGDILAVGSWLADRTTTPGERVDVGAVYVYHASFPFLLFELETLLRPAGAADFDWFGHGVDLYRSSPGSLELVAGAPGEDAGGDLTGAAYRYRRVADAGSAAWVPVARMVDSNPSPFARLGYSVAVSRRGVLAAAPQGTPAGGEEGGVVLFFSSAVFADGFESGGTSAWSDVVP